MISNANYLVFKTQNKLNYMVTNFSYIKHITFIQSTINKVTKLHVGESARHRQGIKICNKYRNISNKQENNNQIKMGKRYKQKKKINSKNI